MLYIHIGLPKTATTFMQERVFPYWNNIEYLGRNRGHDVPFKKIVNIKKEKKYLLSEEGISGLRFKTDEEKELAIKNLSEMFPNAKIIISFRKHQGLINSIYKQSIRRGEVFKYEEFFNMNNTGDLSMDAINYSKYIKTIEKYFKTKPFVYLQEELKYNVTGLLSDMGDYFGEEEPNINKLDMSKINEGIGYYQGNLLLKMNKIFKSQNNFNGILPYNKFTHISRSALIHFCLKTSFFIKKPIKMTNLQAQLVDEYYEDDWNFVLNYIEDDCPYRKHFDRFNFE